MAPLGRPPGEKLILRYAAAAADKKEEENSQEEKKKGWIESFLSLTTTDRGAVVYSCGNGYLSLFRGRSGGLFLLSSSFPPKALLRGCAERPERVKKERGEECWCNKNESLFYSSLVSPGYKFPPFLREAKLRNPLIFPDPSFRKKITTIILWLCDSLSWRA